MDRRKFIAAAIGVGAAPAAVPPTGNVLISYQDPESPAMGIHQWVDVSVYGHAPVQGEGTVLGKHWYFRSRWNLWSLDIADTMEDAIAGKGWCLEEEYGDEDACAASWMDHDEAVGIIRRGFDKYVKSIGQQQ